MLQECIAAVRADGRHRDCQCPAHDDKKASLSVTLAPDGRILLYCHALCTFEAVIAAAGIDPRELAPERHMTNSNGREIVAEYDYTDEQGTLLYQVCRFAPKDFRQRKPDGAGGWTWKLGTVRRVLFGLRELTGNKIAYLPEGEKDVLALRALGLPATCNAGGAGKWRDEYTRQLRDAGVEAVVIFPDNDEPGRQHAEAIARSCHAAGLRVKVVTLPVPPKGDVSDWIAASHTKDELVALAKTTPLYETAETAALPDDAAEITFDDDEPKRPEPVKRLTPDPPALPSTFEGAEDRYRFVALDGMLEFVVDRLHREKHELFGELQVRCYLPGAHAYEDVLSVGTFNLSSPRARQERAKLLSARARAKDPIDFGAYLEEFCQRTIAAERRGQPAIILSEVALSSADTEYDFLGLRLPQHHPSFLFGDGGSLKSYAALYCAGILQQDGVNTGFVDWELDAEAHRRRLARLFGDDLPPVRYVRCDRPLIYEVDRLQRIIRDEHLGYAVFDSVAFATHGPPESAEAAAEYFRAVRRLRIGGLHIAHVTKTAENGSSSEHKPFGSVFWHNGARSTWFVKRAEQSGDESRITIGIFHRKANLGPLQPAVGFEISFEGEHTTFRRTSVANVADLAAGLPLWKRIQTVLRDGPKAQHEIVTLTGAKADTIKKTLGRGEGKTFVRLTNAEDGVHRWALLERERGEQHDD